MTISLSFIDTIPYHYLVGVITLSVVLYTYVVFPKRRHNDPTDGPISQQGLEALAVHRYKSSEYTILDDILNPWWTWAASKLPKNVAPNVVTLLGWIFYYPADFLIIVSSGHPETIRPSWIYAIGAFSVFWYQTFDAMDGKQARSLGVAGPLGQIMDHGCDAVSTVLLTVLTASALRLEMSGFLAMGFSFLYFFWIGNWAEKYTHVLLTSMSRFFGVTEGQYLSVLIQLIACFSPNFWKQTIVDFIGYQNILQYPNAFVHAFIRSLISCIEPYNHLISKVILPKHLSFDFNYLPLGYIFVWVTMLSGTYVMFMTLYDVSKHIIAETPKGQSTVKRLLIAFTELIPITYVLFLGIAWFLYSAPSEIKPFAGTFDIYPLVSVFGFSFLFVHYICQVIMVTMANEQFPLWHWSVLPFSALIFIDIYPTFSETHQPLFSPQIMFSLWVFCCISTIMFQITWALRVVNQIADLFGIYILYLGQRISPAPVVTLRNAIESRQKNQQENKDGVIDSAPIELVPVKKTTETTSKRRQTIKTKA